jgi:hypothetical protein
MPDREKYRNTMNLGRNDANKHGWKVGDILHTSSSVRANGYNYCGYEEMKLPHGTRVRLIGIKQTNLNAQHPNGIGDVYVDFECVDVKNPDGTPVTCGNRHAWSLLEANPDHRVCPDGSGDLGFTGNGRLGSIGVWYSYAGVYVDNPSAPCGKEYVRDKVIHVEAYNEHCAGDQ